VEDSIAQVLAQPPSEWVAIATVKGEHHLADEALVFLIRAAGNGLPDVIGGLVHELCRRLIRTAKRLAQGFDVSTLFPPYSGPAGRAGDVCTFPATGYRSRDM